MSPKLWTCLKILPQASETFYQEAELISTEEPTFSEINFKQEIKNKSSVFSVHIQHHALQQLRKEVNP